MLEFSILIPSYKKDYFYECIESVISQSFKSFEVIIVDDASPEDLESVVKLFSDPRIKYMRNEKNCGAVNVVDNWNRCLERASGQYVMCIGDDDKLAPDCLEVFHSIICKHPETDVFHCRSFIINEASEIIGLTPSWPEHETIYANMWHRIMGLRVQFIGDFVFNREKLVENGGFYKLPLAWASDDITSFLIMANNGIWHTERPIFFYRKNSLTISQSSSAKTKVKAITEEIKWYDNFLSGTRPQSDVDEVFFKSIQNELPHYFRSKIINTIAYDGLKGISDFFYWFSKRQSLGLGFMEIIYAVILAIKKKLGGNK